MGDVVSFRRPTPAQRNQGNTLCRRGFHKWVLTRDNHFDSKQGRLVTEYRCSRCGAVRTTAE
jgi:hypothetical protein